jgi:hypothetical protein
MINLNFKRASKSDKDGRLVNRKSSNPQDTQQIHYQLLPILDFYPSSKNKQV